MRSALPKSPPLPLSLFPMNKCEHCGYGRARRKWCPRCSSIDSFPRRRWILSGPLAAALLAIFTAVLSPPRSLRNGANSGKSQARRALAFRGEDQAQEFRIDQRRLRSSPRQEANKAPSSRRTLSYSDSQFSSFRPGTRPNSRVLAVINRAPTESECPAMSVS